MAMLVPRGCSMLRLHGARSKKILPYGFSPPQRKLRPHSNTSIPLPVILPLSSFRSCSTNASDAPTTSGPSSISEMKEELQQFIGFEVPHARKLLEKAKPRFSQKELADLYLWTISQCANSNWDGQNLLDLCHSMVKSIDHEKDWTLLVKLEEATRLALETIPAKDLMASKITNYIRRGYIIASQPLMEDVLAKLSLSPTQVKIQVLEDVLVTMKAKGMVPSKSAFCDVAQSISGSGSPHYTLAHEALNLFLKVGFPFEIVPVEEVIAGYGHNRNHIHLSRFVLDMKKRGIIPTKVMYDTMVVAYARCRAFDKVIKLLNKMTELGMSWHVPSCLEVSRSATQMVGLPSPSKSLRNLLYIRAWGEAEKEEFLSYLDDLVNVQHGMKDQGSN